MSGVTDKEGHPRLSGEDDFREIVEAEKKLDDIQDVDMLLESILTETRRIVHADAGSIYVVDGDKLRIKYAQNDTHLKALAAGEKLPYKAFSFEIDEHSIAGYVALRGRHSISTTCIALPLTSLMHSTRKPTALRITAPAVCSPSR